MPTTGLVSVFPPMLPKYPAPPKAKTPPSPATVQYACVGAAASAWRGPNPLQREPAAASADAATITATRRRQGVRDAIFVIGATDIKRSLLPPLDARTRGRATDAG